MSHSVRIGRIDVIATGAGLAAVGFWGVGNILIKYLTGYVGPWSQNALRYSVACLFWLPLLLYLLRRGTFDRRIWRRAIAPAIANIIMQSLFAAAFYYIAPGFLALLSNTSVLWVAGFSLALFPQERALAKSRRFWAGFACSITGLFAVLYFHESFAADATRIGILLILMQAFMWAVYTISVKTSLRGIDPRSGFSVISLYTTAGLWILALLRDHPGQAFSMGMRPWVAVVFSAVTAIALAHVLYYTAIQRIGATIPMLLVLVQPLIVFGLSHVIFHEHLNAHQLVGGAMLLTGSGLSIWAQEHLRPSPPTVSPP